MENENALRFKLLQIEAQINAIDAEKRQLEELIKKLENYNGPLYKMIGRLMIESNKEETIKELQEDLEFLETRRKILENQKTKIENMMKNENSNKS